MTSLGLLAYRAATTALEPFAPMLLAGRVKRGKEDATRLDERLGRASGARPEGPLVWLHGASVGESLMLLPLIEALRAKRSDLALLVTTGTTTSAALMAKRLPAGVIHQYAPVDGPSAARRFIAHWRPGLGVIAESELWPNLLLEAKAHDVRLALINARLTERSLARWRSFRKSARRLLNVFDWIGAADRRTADGLSELSGRTVPLVGNLKFAGAPPAAGDETLATLRATLAGRPTWLAASTHPGEDEIILEAHAGLAEHADASGAPPLLIIAPRHPERGPAVAELSRQRGFKTARRGAGETLTAFVDVYVADTLGEMGLWFRLADATLIGGSLVEGVGGHNPVEPALLGTPIMTGPHVFNFEDLYADLIEAGGAAQVRNVDELVREIRLLDDEVRLTRVEVAQAIASRGTNVLETVVGALKPLLPGREHG